MSRLAFLDRLQTILATATITSAVWILVGTVYVGRDPEEAVDEPVAAARPAADSTAVTEANPPPAAAGGLTIPVAGVRAEQLADSFAHDRGGRRHEAIDIMAPAGTPVVAADAGIIERLFRSDAGGNTIYLRADGGRTIHYYAHLQAYAAGLAEGQRVSQGQRLGTVGSTGNADPAAPHLHFAVLRTEPQAPWWEPATAVNPFPLLRPG